MHEKVKCINNILGLYLENIFNIGSGLLFLSFAAVKFCLVSFLKPWIPKQNRYDMPIKRNYVPNLVFLGCSVQPVSNLFRFLDMQKIEQSLAGKRYLNYSILNRCKEPVLPSRPRPSHCPGISRTEQGHGVADAAWPGGLR